MDNRLNTRKRIRSDATNLAEYVVKTTIEYKQELLELERDNRKLERRNKYMKNTIKKNEETIGILNEEVEMKNIRLNELIRTLGENKVCYTCSHSLCDPSLCVYCQKWVCDCCRSWCDYGIDSDNKRCYVNICSSCSIDNNKCPKHSDDEEALKLHEYYDENKYNLIFNDESSE